MTLPVGSAVLALLRVLRSATLAVTWTDLRGASPAALRRWQHRARVRREASGGSDAARGPMVPPTARAIIAAMPSIRVLPFGLGPIGVGVAKQIAERPGFKIVGAIDIDPAKVGRDLGEVLGFEAAHWREGQRRCREGDQGDQAGRRRALHELVDQEPDAAARDDPEDPDADRLDDRRAVVSGLHTRPAGAGRSTPGPRRPRWRCSRPA